METTQQKVCQQIQEHHKESKGCRRKTIITIIIIGFITLIAIVILLCLFIPKTKTPAVIPNRTPSQIPEINTAMLAMTKTTNNKTKLFGDVMKQIYQFTNYQKYKQLNNSEKDRLGLIMLLNKTNYFTNLNPNYHRVHHCNWPGITCDYNYRVKEIMFHTMRLKGTIRTNLIIENANFLSKLVQIYIMYNHDSEFYVDSFPKYVTKLVLSANKQMVGELSNYVNEDKLSKLQHFEHLILSYNKLTSLNWGKLPKHLNTLDISWNNFSEIDVAEIQNIERLWLDGNKFSDPPYILLDKLLKLPHWQSIGLQDCFNYNFKINWSKDMLQPGQYSFSLNLRGNPFSIQQLNIKQLIFLLQQADIGDHQMIFFFLYARVPDDQIAEFWESMINDTEYTSFENNEITATRRINTNDNRVVLKFPHSHITQVLHNQLMREVEFELIRCHDAQRIY